MNPIIEIYRKNRMNYCHVAEVETVYELQCIIDSIYDEFIEDFGLDTVIDFCTTLEIYCLTEGNEEEVYNFDIKQYLQDL